MRTPSRLKPDVDGTYPLSFARLLRLPEEDLHSIVVWLDLNSNFLGAYKNVAARIKGEHVMPGLE